MSSRGIRIGIDVGGTFTHAVAIDHSTLEIVAKAKRPTTHKAADGVAEGILQCLRDLLEPGLFTADQVVFVAHSTTQATNALLEGDVAKVGLIGIVEGASGLKAKGELSFKDVAIAGDRAISVTTMFAKPSDVVEQTRAFMSGAGSDAGAFAVAEAFAVDDPTNEIAVVETILSGGKPATSGHEVSGLYGLKARARTSVVNASILPKMMDVSEKTQSAVIKMGVKAPLMIMRSDGGVMTAEGMKKTPIHTILSGPAAGVSAAILHEKMSNGLFVEIGGTSTDVSLALNGKPEIRQATIGGNILYLKTLDVRTVGAAGGSMVRFSGGALKDVGPRSAHIAGLPYSCFAGVHEWSGAAIEMISPGKGDPADYAIVVSPDGKRAAITATCAANAAGLLESDDYSRGSEESALAAFAALAGERGDPKKLALEVVERAAAKVEKLCRDLMKEYPTAAAKLNVVGGGGGASVLAPTVAKNLGLAYSRAKDAEVVSAVGVGMALLKNVIEKSVVEPTDEDIKAIRAEARQSIVAAGGDPDKVQVDIEIDKQKHILRAIATGSSTLSSSISAETVTAERALEIAKSSIGEDIPFEIAFSDGGTYVALGVREKRGFLGMGKKTTWPVVVVDGRGLAILTLPNAEIEIASREYFLETLRAALERGTVFNDGGAAPPPIRFACDGRVTDLSKLAGAEAMIELAALEINERSSANEFCIITAKP